MPSISNSPASSIPGGPVIHYDDLDAASARIAHALLDAGCAIGDRIAVQTDKCWQQLALYLACLRAGLVYLPLNTGYRKTELAYFFGDAEPRVIVCAPTDASGVAALRTDATVLTLAGDEGSLLDRARDQPSEFDTVVSAPGDLAALLYTSGTTGRSKGAMLTHRNLATNALALVEHWAFTRGDVLLHALPLFHVHGLFVACHCALLSAGRMLWLPKFDTAEVVKLLPHATVMMGVPTYLLAPAWRPRVRRRGLPNDPRVHLRLGAAAGGDVQLVCRAYRTVDRRTLRHDRNRHEYVQSARR